MSRFIISRTEVGVSFLLRSDTDRFLAESKPYATLDACKKAIGSMVNCLATAPLTDRAVGEDAPNPKIEICEKRHEVWYTFKASNGKSVLIQGPYATRKAALRAIAMLRAAMQKASVWMETSKGVIPLTFKASNEK